MSSLRAELQRHKRDAFIEVIKSLLLSPFVMHSSRGEECSSDALRQAFAEVFSSVERMVDDHRRLTADGKEEISKLRSLVPSLGLFFTPLPLERAFKLFDSLNHVSGRRFVPPTFNDIRHILNFAQMDAIRKQLKLVTFDGDETIYADGADLTPNSPVVPRILSLLQREIHVALVTAAGYKNNPKRYEQRLAGLLKAFKAASLPADVVGRFYVLGGECNFLFRTKPDYTFEPVPWEEYKIPEVTFDEDRVQQLLDVAESSLRAGCERQGLPLAVLRKPRAVGTYRPPDQADFICLREHLDELALTIQHEVQQAQTGLPFCAFNGGQDVWVDVGNKQLGTLLLQIYLSCDSSETVHFGDQFLSTGNDIATRQSCCTAWISNPEETYKLLDVLLEQPHASRVPTPSLPSA